MQNYILGYGSLIESESRLRTTPNAIDVFPIWVKGFKRGWFARIEVPGYSTTFLGCIRSPENLLNGVVYPTSDYDLNLLDKREKGYTRVKIDSEKVVKSVGLDITADTVIWIYVNLFDNITILKNSIPNEKFPIVQSYLDICINGCFEIEQKFKDAKGFTKDFLETTHYWNEYWVNDRIYPRRPFIYQPKAFEIDEVLNTNSITKSLFRSIKIE